MGDVSDDSHRNAVQRGLRIVAFLTKMLPDSESIEQGLRGMFMKSVACIYDIRRMTFTRQNLRRARVVMPNHDNVAVHRFNVR